MFIACLTKPALLHWLLYIYFVDFDYMNTGDWVSGWHVGTWFSAGVCMCVFMIVYLCEAEFGDYDEEDHGTTDYIGRCKMLPKQTDRQQGVIAQMHQNLM